ncbi:MAG: hypothetical protein JXB42_09875 [Deltaproteobacteria bacterium]|nr:hypothetical protein [Deltaproteobacteria bacterium]
MEPGNSSIKRKYDAPLFGARYCGDRATQVVHDMDNAHSNCRIEEILSAGMAVPFQSVTVAHIQGYRNCGECMGGTGI